jgi:tripartite-type tricarboxylate transporter receptor subunit TctC
MEVAGDSLGARLRTFQNPASPSKYLMNSFHRSRLKLAFGALLLGCALASTAAYPDKPVRIVVPYAPGGSSDVIARSLSDELGRELGQPVIIDNRAGAGSLLGTQHVAGEPATGYTLLLADVPFTIAPALYRERARYRVDKSFEAVSLIGVAPMYLFVNRSSPVRTVGDLLQQAKAAPGTLSIGSGGNGSLTHLFAELFMMNTGAQLTHIPYKGAGPALNDLAAGQIQASFTTMPTANALFRAGRVRPVAVSSPERTREAPEIPTFRELGMTGMTVPSWWGLLAPAGTPEEVIRRLADAMDKVLRDPKVLTRLHSVGLQEGAANGPAELQKLIAADAARWQEVVQRAKITVD